MDGADDTPQLGRCDVRGPSAAHGAVGAQPWSTHAERHQQTKESKRQDPALQQVRTAESRSCVWVRRDGRVIERGQSVSWFLLVPKIVDLLLCEFNVLSPFIDK